MARLNFLDRFRPVGAPGPAGPIGVPASDNPGPAAELAPVFAALAADVDASAAVVEAARLHAEHDMAKARTQAAAILSRARLDAGAERARAAAHVERAAAQKDQLVIEQAHREAATLEASAMARIPSLVDEVIDDLLGPGNAGTP